MHEGCGVFDLPQEHVMAGRMRSIQHRNPDRLSAPGEKLAVKGDSRGPFAQR